MSQKFRFNKHKESFVIAHAALRIILGCYTDSSPKQLRFEFGAFGKPTLKHGDQKHWIQFNLSHSHNLALCAIALKRNVGIDIEYLNRRIEFYDIAKQIFSPKEMMVLNSSPSHKQLLTFYNLWTRKEAFLKAIGEGLSLDVKNIDISRSLREKFIIKMDSNTNESINWTIQELTVHPNYTATLVIEGYDLQTQYFNFSPYWMRFGQMMSR